MEREFAALAGVEEGAVFEGDVVASRITDVREARDDFLTEGSVLLVVVRGEAVVEFLVARAEGVVVSRSLDAGLA